MDYVRSASARAPMARAQRRKLRTGPLLGVPWRDLERRGNIEDHLPVLILLGFALLAAIQALLVL